MSALPFHRRAAPRRFIALTLCAVTLSASPLCLAKPTWKEIATANRLADEGRKAEAAGDFESALAAFEESGRLHDTPANRRRLARAKAGLGRLLEARSELAHVVEDAKAPRDQVRRAQAELEALNARIPKLRLDVDAQFSGEIELNGEPLTSDQVEIDLDPGSHKLFAAEEGYRSLTENFELTEGERVTLRVALEPLPVGAPPVAQDAAPPEKDGISQRTWGYVSLGVGVVGVAVGGYFGLSAQSTRDDLRDACPNDRCPAGLRSRYDEGERQAMWSTVGFIIGGAGLITGAALLLTAPKTTEGGASSKRAPRPSGVTWHPEVGLSRLGVQGSF
ncbi:MAG: hypothetical protein KIT72_07920 [Polyangiaceae bacterium]|nr:hypothetical protein [Polyangiaceae bacterium]MCW5790332.1 hypothetical protein [Polyangiaceae bacterium]